MKIVKGNQYHVELPDSIKPDLLVRILERVFTDSAGSTLTSDLNVTQIWQLIRQLDRLEAELKLHGTTFNGSAFGRHMETLNYAIRGLTRLRVMEAERATKAALALEQERLTEKKRRKKKNR